MTPAVEKIRAMLVRALAEAEEAGDLKSALDISKMLLPLEEKIEERESAAAAAAKAARALAYEHLSRADFKARAVALLQRVEALDDDDALLRDREAAEAVGLTSTSPIPPPPKTAAPIAEAPIVTSPLADTTVPEPDPRCPFCTGPAPRCAAIVNDPRWLTEHQNRPDVKQRLDSQAEIRRRLGWDEAIVRDPLR